ncbi:carbohydrate sulfotransferase 9-like isoform X1 [Branchiostoma floridae]|uniref:Carbohydrate sulfotransferase n=1 Tax=Branchiostoma floridae TaxID=7739 RepID=A0A9J7MAL7_BRAFL|nr:carbohydrate sulfotransferase 9-like isoform X1 [Branchiostoma floridae]
MAPSFSQIPRSSRRRYFFVFFGIVAMSTIFFVRFRHDQNKTEYVLGRDVLLPQKTISMSTIQGSEPMSLEQEQAKRMAVFKDYCRRHQPNTVKPVANETISRFIVNDKYKILYCFVPKTGTTTTKHVFYNLEHGTNTTTLFLGSKHLKFLSEYTDNEILRRLETYIKFIVVRDPLERLASSWKNKFMDIRGAMRYWFIEHYQSMLETIGDNEPGEKITYQDVNWKHIPFLAFIRAIARNQTRWMNPHWQPVYQLCSPCQVNWDYIAHTETLVEDFHLFFKKAGIVGRENIIPKMEERVGSRFYLEGFMKIPLEEIQRIGELYQSDYDMFGYSFQEDLDNLMKHVIKEKLHDN